MKKKNIFIGLLSFVIISCSMFQSSGDPYANTSGTKTTTTNSSNTTANATSKATTKVTTKANEAKTTVTEKATTTKDKVETKTEKVVKETKEKATKATKTTKNTDTTTVDEKFDETDQKIVDFIAEKVKENGSQIKKITVDGVNKLQKEKNIRMTKREFLARTYQIIRDNKMTSYYLASARLLNQMK